MADQLNRRGRPMRQLLVDPDDAAKLVDDLQNLREIINEDISDTASDGTNHEADQRYITSLEARSKRLGDLIFELSVTPVILDPTPETEEQKSKRLEREIVDQVAEELFRAMTELDNEVIEEMVEDYLAFMAPLVPMNLEDPDVTQEYLAYESAQRRIYRLAWLGVAKLLMDEFAETER